MADPVGHAGDIVTCARARLSRVAQLDYALIGAISSIKASPKQGYIDTQ